MFSLDFILLRFARDFTEIFITDKIQFHAMGFYRRVVCFEPLGQIRGKMQKLNMLSKEIMWL